MMSRPPPAKRPGTDSQGRAPLPRSREVSCNQASKGCFALALVRTASQILASPVPNGFRFSLKSGDNAARVPSIPSCTCPNTQSRAPLGKTAAAPCKANSRASDEPGYRKQQTLQSSRTPSSGHARPSRWPSLNLSHVSTWKPESCSDLSTARAEPTTSALFGASASRVSPLRDSQGAAATNAASGSAWNMRLSLRKRASLVHAQSRKGCNNRSGGTPSSPAWLRTAYSK
mmetsp:Transcript_105797/g.268830  ORF Transcript_105797/g.268830 Transcript_105797/m.268830 type:complete len:230 (-) Transcript_105797:575-1264(-)